MDTMYLSDPDTPEVFISVEEDFAVVEYHESLLWHRDRDPELIEELTYDDGYLLHAATEYALEVIAEEGNLRRGNLDSNCTCDYPCLKVEYHIPSPASEEDAWSYAWPFVAAAKNVLDPGTFGVPYLFNEVQRRMSEEGHILVS